VGKSRFTPNAKKKVLERLVAERNIARRLKEGWKICDDKVEDKHGRKLGVRTHAKDLTLMTKEM